MVDVSAKAVSARRATAKGSVYMAAATLALITSGKAAKGDVLTTAQLAGVMAAKRTHELIPLCHPLALTHVEVVCALEAGAAEPLPSGFGGAVSIRASVRCRGQTGVEMEALTAVSLAALTVYDMCKAADRAMTIGAVRLTHKAGGKSGEFRRENS